MGRLFQVAAVALCCAAAASPARGDALVVTQAMKASTIAEIFVQKGSVRIELEIAQGDLQGMGLAGAPRVDAPVPSGWLLRADGTALKGTVAAVEQRRRVKRDEITGEPMRAAEGEGEPVTCLEVTFPFEGTPKTLTIRPPMVDDRVAVTIGFVAYHEGIPVTDFRYLGLEATLGLDWDDPWYSKFRHRNLRRRFAAPLSAFLYVDEFEVRQEIVLRPKDLQHFVDLGLEGKQVIAASEQEALKQKIVGFLADKNPVTIDGKPAKLFLDRVHFIRQTLRMTSIIDLPEDLDVVSATMGVIFYAPTKKLAKDVTMRWDLWTPRIQTITAIATDEAGGFPTQLTPDDNVLTWQNFLKNPTGSRLTSVPPPAAPLSLPVVSVLCLLALVPVGLLARRRKAARLALPVLVVLAAVLWSVAHVDVADRSASISEAQSRDVVTALLKNIYVAFDRRGEDPIFDVLARSVHGKLLEQTYVEVYKALTIQSQGGPRIKVKEVQLVEFKRDAASGDAGFTGTCTWTVRGSIGHWGHLHERVNRYEARVEVGPVDGAWKYVAMELLDEARIS